MNRHSTLPRNVVHLGMLAAALWLHLPSAARADDPTAPGQTVAQGAVVPPAAVLGQGAEVANPTAISPTPSAAAIAAAGKESSGEPQHASLLKEAKSFSGLWTLHQKGNSLFVELGGGDYNAEYLILISISRGIGQAPLLGGMTWGDGNEWVWQFRKVDNHVHVIRKNVRFRANSGSREAFAVRNAYSDSVLFSLPIITKGPKGGDLVDLSAIFMSDLPQISRMLPGFSFASNKSTWEFVKAFKDNVELQLAATYASSGYMEIDSVPDSRGVTLGVHYSISRVPQNGYQPRLADSRVGYFLTVVKDFSKRSEDEQFVRYINRWQLQKDDNLANPSPPKQPIVFWIEKTVPAKYRPAIQAGIVEWNKAFEKAGFANAIEVRTQPVDADWDPEDVNYNTFRWITSNAGFAMGPSRVNPYTGQILDADIIFDADFLSAWSNDFEILTPQTMVAQAEEQLAKRQDREHNLPSAASWFTSQGNAQCRLSQGMASQFAFTSAVLHTMFAEPQKAAELEDKLIAQGLKEVTMHEVGHTLGLRHNFKASTYLSLADLNNPEKCKEGMVGSVMDYCPSNIMPKGVQQGDFYTGTIGPYDVWAIQYGYTPFPGGTDGEVNELQKIASRSAEPGLAYATDEDVSVLEPDPTVNRFDLGSDTIEFAKQRAKIVADSVPELVNRMSKEGDDYTKVRKAFNVLLHQHGNSVFYASRYIGGMLTSRSHKGDKDAQAPIVALDPQKQREALAMLEEYVFNDKPFQFSPDLYPYLEASSWSHWGSSNVNRKDFPIHDSVLRWQREVLDYLLSSVTLKRIHDAELKTAPDKDVLTTAELIERVTKAIFAEVDNTKEGDFNNRKPAISSLRRNLQRAYLKDLSRLAMGNSNAPQDCQTIAFAELSSLEARITQLLKSNVKLDSYSRAHLTESASRIQKVLEARLTLSGP